MAIIMTVAIELKENLVKCFQFDKNIEELFRGKSYAKIIYDQGKKEEKQDMTSQDNSSLMFRKK